ncbi:MAG: energy-coupling factor ABC transporter ATP-binding protein [Treponema sp.]|jgi:biotin transport system ATP-binding protein|nr:energy-coupling factor ABC transporter ATP-binding protein [Treponema sp.]
MPPLFSVHGLSKRFANGCEALVSVSMDIAEGECLLVAGSNGSGKTVLTRILAGLTEPSAGEVLFRGEPLASRIALLRRTVGLVFQDADAQIVGETVAEDIAFGPENLRLSREAVRERVEDALARFALADKRGASPRSLSGGEKRRLAVAGVAAMGCEAVILDEPFANLDWHGVRQVLQVIQNLKNDKRTVILLTHELEKALAFADRLLILHKGEIKADGPPDAVLDMLDPAWGVRDPRGRCDRAADCTWL